METPLYANLKVFLKPIPGKVPEGKDMKYEAVYDHIKEASREDLDLPQGVWVQDLKSADWKKTELLCADVLKNHSKDLQVTAWLLEAWLSLYHMNGLKAGLDLLFQMTTKFWDVAYPQLKLDDPEFRQAPFNWINEKLADRFNKIEVTYPESQDLKTYSYATYLDIHKDGGVRVTASEEAKDKERNPERFKKSINATKDEFFQSLTDTGNTALSLLKELQTFLDGKFPENGPSLYHAQNKIKEIVEFAEQVLEERYQKTGDNTLNVVSETSPTAPTETSPETPEPAPNKTDLHVDTVLSSRLEAYAVIEKAANYLEKLDPHSPSPHLIKRAIKWGNLSLKDLLNEMVKDPQTLGELNHLLGITSKEISDNQTDSESSPNRENNSPAPSTE